MPPPCPSLYVAPVCESVFYVMNSQTQNFFGYFGTYIEMVKLDFMFLNNIFVVLADF